MSIGHMAKRNLHLRHVINVREQELADYRSRERKLHERIRELEARVIRLNEKLEEVRQHDNSGTD